jgi:hypothetical protein
MSLAPAIVLVRAPIERLNGASQMVEVVTCQHATEPVATIQAPIGDQPIAERRMPIVLAQRDDAPTATHRAVICQAGPIASAPDQPVRRQFFRHSLARVCV